MLRAKATKPMSGSQCKLESDGHWLLRRLGSRVAGALVLSRPSKLPLNELNRTKSTAMMISIDIDSDYSLWLLASLLRIDNHLISYRKMSCKLIALSR